MILGWWLRWKRCDAFRFFTPGRKFVQDASWAGVLGVCSSFILVFLLLRKMDTRAASCLYNRLISLPGLLLAVYSSSHFHLSL
ncbi:hypothetical protein V8C35DRAFT_54497 [Trichoderma chlorosporum]